MGYKGTVRQSGDCHKLKQAERGEILTDEILTIDDVVGILKLPSKKSGYAHAEAGNIPGVIRVGRLLRFRASDVRRLIDGNEPAKNEGGEDQGTDANQ